MKKIRGIWYKSFAVILLLGSVIASFIVPLSPGVISVTPAKLTPGSNQVVVEGYNTHFDKGNNKTWIITESGFAVEAGYSTPINDHLMEISVILPNQVPSQTFDLAINNPNDGTFFLDGAFYADKVLVKEMAMDSVPQIPLLEENYFSFPFKNILYESIRNLNFHVTMWFALMFCMTVSVYYSIKQLGTSAAFFDITASESAKVGLWFAIIGIVTGSIWARFTWGSWWVNDSKLNGAAISTLVYLAYFILRNSLQDEEKRARISAVYNIFAFVMLIVFIQILPRMTDSLHPGNGGNPAFSQYDLDNNMRMVFYPAIAGWILIASWMISLRRRMTLLKNIEK